MKTILLHYTSPPVVGGVESVLGQHARLMAKDGYLVSILAGRGAQIDPGIPFIELPAVDSRHPDVSAVKAELDSGRVTQRFHSLTSALVEGLEGLLTDVDLLFAHNVCSLHKNLALTAALHTLFEKPRRCKLVIWHHDLAWTAPRYQMELHPGYPWDLLRMDWPNARQVTISEPRRKELAELFQIPTDRIQVIPNGIDAPRFWKLNAQTLSLVEKLGLNSGGPLFLLPVRITSRKNIELAIQTLNHLKNQYPQARLIVTGPLGPHNPANQDYFRQLTTLRSQLNLENDAIFLAEQSPEYIPDEVISDFYRLADALFLPSREEGFGIPVLEGGISNLPVFCADIPALRELGGDWATYFSPDASPEFVTALIVERLASDLSFNLRMQVKGSYTWRQIYAERIKPLFS